MATVNLAPPASSLIIRDTNIHLFQDATGGPCMLPISGASNFALKPFNVRASGNIKPFTNAHPLATLILYAQTAVPTPAPLDPTAWIALATTAPSTQLNGECMWMIAGVDMMYSLATGGGRTQGTFQSNVNNLPVTSAALQNNLTTIQMGQDPVIVFALGVSVSIAAPPSPCVCRMTLFEQYD